MLHGGVEEPLDFGKGYDLVELRLNLCLGHTEDRAVQENVFPPCQLGMKAGSDFQQAGNPPVDSNTACGWLGNSRQYFK